MKRYTRQAGQSNGQNSAPGRATIPSSIAARGGRHATRCAALSSATERVRQHSAHGMPPSGAAERIRRHSTYPVVLMAAAERVRQHSAHGMPPSGAAERIRRHSTYPVVPTAAAERVRQHSAHGMPPPRAVGSRGFTLIEMMIVIVIVSVLLLVGLPAYRKQVIQGNRAEGTAALLRIMDRQERYYANNFPPTYASSMTGLGFSSTTLQTENGHYSIEIGTCTGSTIKSCVKLTATAQGGQTNDGDLTLNSRGEKTRCGKTGWEHLEDCP